MKSFSRLVQVAALMWCAVLCLVGGCSADPLQPQAAAGPEVAAGLKPLAPRALYAPVAPATSEQIARALTTLQQREYLGVDWAPTLLHFQVEFKPAQARPEQVRVVNADGRELFSQMATVKTHPDGSVAAGRLSFVAGLDAYQTYRFHVLKGRPAPQPALRAAREGEFLQLDNGLTALRLPAPGTKSFNPPLRFDGETTALNPDARRTVGPLRGVRLNNGVWTGGSYFFGDETTPKITGYTSEVLAQGAAFVMARVRYQFDNGGFYQFTARLVQGEAAAYLDEQMDTRKLGSGYTWRVVFSLAGNGWKPDTAFYLGDRLPGQNPDFAARLLEAGVDSKALERKTLNSDNRWNSRRIDYSKPFDTLFNVSVWYPWAPVAHAVAFADTSALSPQAVQSRSAPFLGLVPLHPGNWRNDQNGFQTSTLYSYQTGDVQMHWALMASPHPADPLQTGEYDPQVEPTFIRRQWALVAGPFQYLDSLTRLRDYEGNVSLDDYKDWILDWPSDPKVTYPRLAFAPQEARRLSATASDGLFKDYFITDAATRDEVFKQLVLSDDRYGSLRGQFLDNMGGGDYRQTQNVGNVIWMAERLLASPILLPEQRQRLRATLAAICYQLTEPDFHPRGSMVHLGTPNMPTNRTLGLAFAASLIPDHPRAGEWLDFAAQYTRYKLAANVAPGGAWSELISYFQASAPHLMQAAFVLDRQGRLDEKTLRLAALPARFTLQLLTPRDPRFDARFLPNWGHEGNEVFTHWLVAVALLQERDPKMGRSLSWAWHELGRPSFDNHDAGFSRALAPVYGASKAPEKWTPPQLGSAWLPGFGAVLRAHAGSPDETYLSYRQGYHVSHSDANQGDFALYSKGAPLTTLSLFQYAVHDNRPFDKLKTEFGWHNRVRFGEQTNDGGWPGGGTISQVQAHEFGASADYLRGVGEYGPQRWTRQFMFLKGRAADGPNYFVLRDSFKPSSQDAAPQPKWWFLRTPGAQALVQSSATGFEYSSPYETKLNVRFLQPATVDIQSRDATQSGPIYGGAAQNWLRAGSPVVSKQHENNITIEETTTVTAVGPVAAGQDIVAVLYPRDPNEAVPQQELLAEGAVRITTAESTDYVFISDRKMEYSKGDVGFEGKAGAVRVYRDAVHLVLSEGPGRVRFGNATLISDGPAQKIVTLAETVKPTVWNEKAAPSPLQFALNAGDGAIQNVAPGVQKQTRTDGFAYRFHSAAPLVFEQDGVIFRGRRGGLVVNTARNTTRAILLDGEKIGYNALQLWLDEAPEQSGALDVTWAAEAITGRSTGQSRFAYITPPPGLNRLPMLLLDGQTYAPGKAGNTIIVALLPGEHSFELKNLFQPPIFRNWQAWQSD